MSAVNGPRCDNDDKNDKDDRDWWRGAVIYQIYPSSFRDHNGDGIGDLPGITGKLDYLARLGVDALWISPFMKSPMKDFGYDVSDYRDVDPRFGTLADFDALLDGAHRRGLRVLIDLVPAHTSDQHPWFVESRRSRTGPRADWYVWHDPKADGSPPTNWLSVFGGVAWQWEPRRGQYYLHHFLSSQPALNHHQPAVREAVLGEAAFWLERGVDGLRLDAINYCLHDRLFRDNPPRPPGPWAEDGTTRANPYRMQRHVHDKSQAENLIFLRQLRAQAERHGAVTLGEVGDDDAIALSARYTQGQELLHQAYSFALLRGRLSARFIHDTLAYTEECLGDGWSCWAFSNHDVPRVVSRWGGACPAGQEGDLARLLLALLLSLRGSVCLYQGEELGLPEAELSLEQIRDPYGLAFWPEFKGRDGCRTPMPWVADEPRAGFSGPAELSSQAGHPAADPWLPIPAAHRARAVDVQERDEGSVLHACRLLLAFRRAHPALRCGTLRLLDHDEPILAFERGAASERILAVFNLSPAPARLSLAEYSQLTALAGHGFAGQIDQTDPDSRQLSLPGYHAFFAALPLESG